MVNIQKAAVIGCGFVGSTIAYTLMQKGLFSEMVLLDANKAKAEGEAMDISHGLPFTHAMDIYAGEYEDIADASVVIITAGANQKPGETRLDLVQKNAAIMRSIIKEIKRVNCEGILLIVSNPVDILTEVALRESGFPKERVIGSGTVLDTARLKYIISEKLDVDSRNKHCRNPYKIHKRCDEGTFCISCRLSCDHSAHKRDNRKLCPTWNKRSCHDRKPSVIILLDRP